MPKRSAVEMLPDEVKAELNRKLIRRGFSGYVALAEWLEAKGFGISKSAIHRYGQDFEERLAALKVATEQAKAIAESAPDNEGALNDALIRVIQEKAFRALVDMGDPGKQSLTGLGRMIAELNQASVRQKEFMAKLREKTTLAAEKVEKMASQGGLSPALVRQIKNEVLGVTK